MVMGLPHGRMSDRGCVVEDERLIFLNSYRFLFHVVVGVVLV
jgi:hypothetical protein